MTQRKVLYLDPQTFLPKESSIEDELVGVNTVPEGGLAGQVLKKNSNNSYDYSWQPETSSPNSSLSFNSAETILAYKLITTNIDGLAIYASSDNFSSINKIIGVSKNSATVGGLVYVETSGLLTNTGWNWVPGQLLYLGLNGDITSSTNTGIFSNNIGYAVTSDSIFINIGRSIVRG